MKIALREKAINLRKQGLSYREIMEQIPIAKSTLSDWLHSVSLARYQKQRLTEKKLASAKRGGETKHRQRVIETRKIIESAKKEIGAISKHELWLIGTMLYWAEGSKEKEYDHNSRVAFTNTDADMICLFLRWLKEICGKNLPDITFDIYIHKLHEHKTSEIIDFWARTVGCSPVHFQHIYYKKGNPKTIRKNTGSNYNGTIRISVKSSSSLNRKIAGWTRGVVESFRYWGVV